jgi:KRAB domain-containing zinc finger protein
VCHQHSLCTGTKVFTCEHCNIDFRTQVLLTSHTRNLHQSRMFICDQCGHSAASKGALAVHNIVHQTERNFQCSSCSFAFKDRRGLETHKLSHQPKCYECHLCGKFYRSLNTIKIHMKLCHIQPDNGYKCSICTKSFVDEVDRDRHVVTHRSTMAICEICEKQYSNKKSLQLHRQVEHENLRFECYVCHQVIVMKFSCL